MFGIDVSRVRYRGRYALALLTLSAPSAVLAGNDEGATVAAVGVQPAATVEAWRGWRGAARDGALPTSPWLGETPAELKRRWSRQVGIGHASPVVGADRVFLHTRNGDAEAVWCLAVEDGRTLWHRTTAADPVKTSFAARGHGKGPKATPLLAGETLITFGMTGTLTAWQASSGEQRWQVETGVPAGTPTYGVSSSPMVWQDRIVVAIGEDKAGALLALELENGAELWRVEIGTSYSSPLIVEVEGAEQLLFLGKTELLAVDPTDGAKLWSYPYQGKGFAQNVVTPLAVDGTIVLAGEKRPITALRPQHRASGWQVEVLWSNDEAPLEMSSPVRQGDRVVALTHMRKGMLVALDGATGATRWSGEPRFAGHASLVALGPHQVAALVPDGELVLFEVAGDGYQQVRRYEVSDSETWAHPVFVAGGVLIKDQESVALWE